MTLKHGKMRKMMAVSLSATLALGLLAGCTGAKAPESKQEKVLRIGVMYGSTDDSYFRQQYTDIYEYDRKNVKIEIVPAIDPSEWRYNDGSDFKEPDYLESIKKIMTGSNPVDIVMTDTSSLKQLIQDNMLKQLDPLIQEDKFDTSDFVPAVIDGIKDLGEGSIYALTPTFTSSALYYNKKIFAEAGVEPPTDKMTWDDMLNLAKRVAKGSGKDRTYGFSFERYRGNDLFWGMQYTYMAPLQLRTYDEKAETMTVNSPQWVKAWDTLSTLVKEQVIPNNSDYSFEEPWTPVSNDMFLSGKVAMVISESNYVNEIAETNANAAKIKDYTPIDWDVVTVPVHPEKPDIGGNVYLSSTFAINNNAPNPESAWDYIKFITGEDWAKLKSRSNSYEMIARKSYLQPRQGQSYNLEAFYALKPVPPANPKEDKLKQEKRGLYSVENIGRNYLQEVLENKKSVTEALKDWAEKGNKMLQEIKLNPKIEFQEDGTPYLPETHEG